MYNFVKKIFFHKTCSYTFLAVLCIFFLLFSCKEENDILNEARLNVVVVDDLGNAITGAKVYIFENQQAYENARVTGSYTAAKDSATSISSGITLILEGNKEHWVLVKFFDSVRNFFLTNTGDGKIEKLEKQSVIEAKLYIAPVGGNIAFWTQSTNKLPVKVTFDNVARPDLSSSMTAAPTAGGNPNALNISVKEGTYQYYAIAGNDCIWTGTVTVSRGGFQAIEFQPCIRGRISFFASNYNTIHGPITVSLDNNDYLGTISNAGFYTCGSGSGPGSGTNFISVTRDLNTYTYVAKSQDGACAWTGTVTLNSDMCVVIDLPYCTP